MSDGQHLFVATGNTSTGSTWGGGDGVYRLDPGPTWPGGTAVYWAPSDWKSLDDADLDTSTALLVDAPGSTPSALVAAFGKNGVGYLLDRANLGGVGGEKSQRQLSGEINGAAVTYASDAGTFVVVRAEGPGVACTGGTSGNLVAMTVGPAAGIVPAWCAGSATPGVPIATMSSPGQDPLVWEVSQGSSVLHVFDGLTGAELHAGSTALAGVSYFNTPIVAKGRVFVAGSRVYAFRP